MRRLAALPLALLALAPRAVVAQDERPAAGAAATAIRAFTADLLRSVAADGGNLFVSPTSIALALAMTRAGAAGATAAQMDAALHLPQDAAAAFRDLSAALADVPTVRQPDEAGGRTQVPAYVLSIANGLFSQEGWAFSDAFRATIADAYRAELRTLDFRASPAARDAINAWVEKHTADKIKNIVPEGLPTPDTRMVLANAIHFLASWDEPFRESETRDAPFTVAPGSEVTAKLMHRTARLAYAETDDAQVVALPYVRGATAMIVVLPRAKDGLDALVRSLTPERLAEWTGATGVRKVAVALPRFSFTTPLTLGPVLRRLGIVDAFDGGKADFTGITKEKPFFVGEVLHKAFVAVDEKGTEAAAATVVMIRAGSAPRPEEPVPFVVDHPFLFVLVHRTTGTPLFVGRVVDPTRS
ncbi:MAG: serpin family protein [Planctomycetes bacterium]|nr:serpin family protein [Planctomycetota bacterium]